MRAGLAANWDRLVAAAQGAYYAVTGAWAWVSLPSFLLVTGPKTDTWLVQTVGALVVAIALPLLVSAWRGRVHAEIRLLAACSAVAFLFVDVIFYLQGRIGAIYLGDALLEFAFVLAWMACALVSAGRPPADA